MSIVFASRKSFSRSNYSITKKFSFSLSYSLWINFEKTIYYLWSIEKTILFFSQPADPSRVIDFEKFRKNLMKIVEGICVFFQKKELS